MDGYREIGALVNLLESMIERKMELAQASLQLLTLQEVAELLSISHQHLTKNIMHLPDFPKPVRLNERGSLRFYKHEIDEYILGLKERA